MYRIYFIENHGFDQKKAPNSNSVFSTQGQSLNLFWFCIWL
jgi:hypothetical protein